MASPERGAKHPDFKPAQGAPLEKLDYSLAEMIGTDYNAGLLGRAKTATYGQLLRYNGWALPGGDGTFPIPESIFSEEEILSIIKCIEAKTGRAYYRGNMRANAGYPTPACTTCVP